MQSAMYPYINTGSIKRLLKLVDRGLCSGMGNPEEMVCVEAAWWLARGGDPAALSYRNECVGGSVRSFRITLNDSFWSSEQARSDGMRQLAIAGLGSAHLNQYEFSSRVAVRFIREVLPLALRAAAKVHPRQKHQKLLNEAADQCAAAGAAAGAAEAAAEAAAGAAARAAARAAVRAARAAVRAAGAAAEAAAEAAAGAAARAAARAARAAARAAGAAEAAVRAAGDEILLKSAAIATEVLIEMGSEGSKFLSTAATEVSP